MKIFYKLSLGFLMITLLICLVGYFAIYASQKALRETIGENSADLAEKVLNTIDRYIYNRIERWQVYVAANQRLQETILLSNQEFERLPNIQDYINQQDKEWLSAPQQITTPFMKELIDGELSQDLRARTNFYEQQYGYKVFAEVFATNKYGANIAQTDRTTDYRQDDEQWWRKAKEDYLYVADAAYDKSAGIYSTDIGIRVNDSQGNFIGAMKLILNIKEAIRIIDDARAELPYRTANFTLLTKEGRLVYTTAQRQRIFSQMPDFELLKGRQRHKDFFTTKAPDKKERMIAYDHSKGYRDFKGLGWILIVEHETKEIFAPVARLGNNILVLLVAAVLLALFLGSFISRSIANPLARLRAATGEIGKGKLNIPVDVCSNDEVGDLAASFRKMLEDLKTKITSIDELDEEIKRRRRAEENLKDAYSELKEAQAQLIHSAKMSSIGQLAAGMAHEVNNPLTAILGEAEMLRGDEGLGKEAQESIKVIMEQGARIKEITERLLEFSRKKKFEQQPVDINQAVEEAVALLTYQTKTQEIEIVKELNPKLGRVLGDKHQLQEVFLNIMLNAMQAMPGKGTLTVKTYTEREEYGRRRSDIFKHGQQIAAIEIKDTGCGMDEKTLFKIFDPFFSTKKEKNTGLGLSICYGIMQNHKGDIEVESKVGEGSTFIVKLPVFKKEGGRQ